MRFITSYDLNRKPSPSGSRYRNNYIKDASGELIKTGVEDVYDSIQKAAPGNCIEDLIRRATNGDTTAIPPVVDSFVDVSGAPKDLLEANNLLNKVKTDFYSLSKEVRSQFNNNFNTYLSSVADGSIVSKLQPNKTQSSPEASPLSSDELTKIRSMIGGTTNA